MTGRPRRRYAIALRSACILLTPGYFAGCSQAKLVPKDKRPLVARRSRVSNSPAVSAGDFIVAIESASLLYKMILKLRRMSISRASLRRATLTECWQIAGEGGSVTAVNFQVTA